MSEIVNKEYVDNQWYTVNWETSWIIRDYSPIIGQKYSTAALTSLPQVSGYSVSVIGFRRNSLYMVAAQGNPPPIINVYPLKINWTVDGYEFTYNSDTMDITTSMHNMRIGRGNYYPALQQSGSLILKLLYTRN